ncbi:MAG: PD-(D/E)XK nuclease family protein [Elusimicrobiota bacterium]|jgi:hypothetical protein
MPETIDREVAASFFDADAIREAPRRLYRYDEAGLRYYYTLGTGADGEAVANLYPSVTTVIRRTTPMPYFLLTWYAELGMAAAERRRDERAAYGTLMHRLFERLVIARQIDLDALPGVVASYAEERHLPCDTGGWARDLAEDLVGFASFLREKNAKVVGIEVPLASDAMGYAGCGDLFAWLDVEQGNGPGKKKTYTRELCYVDWKSNRTSFYEESEIQCHAYAALWNEEFPESPVTRVCLYGAKDWNEKSKGLYRFSDVTDAPLANIFPNLLEQFRAREADKTRTRISIGGTVSLDQDPASCWEAKPLELHLAQVHEMRRAA